MSEAFPMLDGLKIIDSDTHFSEPHDLWTSRAPGKFKQLVPQVKTIDGKEAWYVNGDVQIGFSSSQRQRRAGHVDRVRTQRRHH